VTRSAASLLSQILESSPLRHAPFRRFYIGSIGAALGYTMQATVAAWLMATLTPSALMVALVQTASTAPSLLFGLLAGALADIVDRRGSSWPPRSCCSPRPCYWAEQRSPG
jgi:MFS family permease